MVRLKAVDLQSELLVEFLFQFQYGSIKSRDIYEYYQDVYPFQFQYGSIKSWCFQTGTGVSIFVSIPIWFD